MLDSDGREGSYHAIAKRLRSMFGLIGAADNTEAMALATRLADYDRLLAEKTETSRQKLAELQKAGDIKTVINNYFEAFAVKDFPPQLALPATPAAIQAWATGLRTWQARLDEAVDYCRLAE